MMSYQVNNVEQKNCSFTPVRLSQDLKVSEIINNYTAYE